MAIAKTIMNNSYPILVDKWSDVWRTADYILASFLILFFLLSTTLNPIVLYHYWKLPSTIPNILYRILAVSDLVTNLARPLVMSFAHLMSEEVESLAQDPNTFSKVITIAIRMSMTMSFAAVALLSLTRAIKIQWPFFHIRKMFIFVWLGGIFIFVLVIVIFNMAGTGDDTYIKRFVCIGTVVAFKGTITEDGRKVAEATKLSKMEICPMYIHAIIAAVVTIWAVVALARTIQQSKVTKTSGDRNVGIRKTAIRKIMEKFKGCGAIVIMNLTSLIMVISLVIYLLQTYKGGRNKFTSNQISFCHSAYLVNMVLPTTIAATNPVILIMFNEELKKKAMFWRKRQRPQSQLTMASFSAPTSQLTICRPCNKLSVESRQQ